MTLERFREILLEYKYPEDLIEKIWEAIPPHILATGEPTWAEETSVRKVARIMRANLPLRPMGRK